MKLTTASGRSAFSVPAARVVWRLITIGLLWLVALPSAQAHLMAEQRGTLNFVGDGVFMVLSLPVSAFAGVDDDGDGKLSMVEFGSHRAAIASAVMREVKLLDERGPRPLEGVLLSLAPPDNAPTRAATQLVVLGRFALTGASSPLRFQAGLFGEEASERTLSVTVTRLSKTETQLLVLTPQQPARDLFPPSWSIFADYVALGAEHIVTGLDHLLFLLVVLAAGWGWQQVLTALTAFTAGHAITLMISVGGGTCRSRDGRRTRHRGHYRRHGSLRCLRASTRETTIALDTPRAGVRMCARTWAGSGFCVN